jgi:hypothetical protein
VGVRFCVQKYITCRESLAYYLVTVHAVYFDTAREPAFTLLPVAAAFVLKLRWTASCWLRNPVAIAKARRVARGRLEGSHRLAGARVFAGPPLGAHLCPPQPPFVHQQVVALNDCEWFQSSGRSYAAVLAAYDACRHGRLGCNVVIFAATAVSVLGITACEEGGRGAPSREILELLPRNKHDARCIRAGWLGGEVGHIDRL